MPDDYFYEQYEDFSKKQLIEEIYDIDRRAAFYRSYKFFFIQSTMFILSIIGLGFLIRLPWS